MSFRILGFLLLASLTGAAQSNKDGDNVDLHVKITKVTAGAKDTLWLGLEGGADLGLTTGLKGYGVQVYNAKVKRDYKTLTRLQVSSVGAKTSQAWMLLPKEESATAYILPGYQAYFPQLPTKQQATTSTLFKPLAALNIRFVSEEDSAFYTQAFLLNSATKSDDRRLIDLFVADVKSTGKRISEMNGNPAAYTDPQKGGRFKGMGVLDAMQRTTATDMEAFLRFVLEYPGKYLGNEWRINETFATWVINNTPLANTNEYLKNSFASVGEADIAAWTKEHRFYTDSLKKYLSADITLQLEEKKFTEAQKAIQRAKAVAVALGDKPFESELLTFSGQILQSTAKADEAVELFTTAIKLDSSNANAYWYRANLYSEAENYTAAIKDLKAVNSLYPAFASAWGNIGWWYLKQFKVADAAPFLRKAYDLDSSNMAFAVNLGHWYLLTNKPVEARRLYQKTLENLKSESEFLQGPLADFDLFAKSGMFQDLLIKEKDWMQDQYNRTYKFYLQSDSLFAIAKKHKNAKEYNLAAQYYLKSREAELAAEKKRPLSIHNITTWVGYTHLLNKDYAKGEKYYQEAVEMAQKSLKPKDLAEDFGLMSDLYAGWGKKALADAYRAESHALEQKAEDDTEDKDLYIVSIGIDNYKDVSYQWAAADAKRIADDLQKKGKGFDHVYSHVLTNEKAVTDSLDKTMQRIVARAKRGDTFIFYFTGKAITAQNESYLIPYSFTAFDNDSLLRNKAISARLLRSWSNSIEAKRQFFLLDAAASNFTSTFASQVAQLNASKSATQKDLTILSATFPRIEKPEFKSSVVAASFINLLSDANATPDKIITCKRVENFFADQVSRNHYYLSLESYSQGRDFTLASYDAAPAKKEVKETTSKFRGAGEDTEVVSSDDKIGKRYGLFIATDNYKDPKWVKLNNPIRDAVSLKKELENNYGFEIETLTNPTYSQIYAKLDEYAKKKFEKNDQFVVLFSGHGYYDPRRNEGYLIPSDALYTDLEFERYYFSFSSIVSNLRAIKARHMLVLMDACHGGALVDKAIMRDGGDDLYKSLERNERIKNHLQNPNRLIITSGRKDQKVYDGTDGNNSPFVTALLNALRSEEVKKTGILSYYSIMKHITEMQKTEAAQGKFDPADNNEFLLEYQPNKLKMEGDFTAAKKQNP